MDSFFNEIQETCEYPWALYSIIRELYDRDVTNFSIIDNSTKNGWIELRSFLLNDKYKTNVIYFDKLLPITQNMCNMLQKYAVFIKTISKEAYESYILISSYPQYLCNENIKDYAHDFINFTNLIRFIAILEIFSKQKFNPTHIKHIFKKYIYTDVYIDQPEYAENIIRLLLVSPLAKKVSINKKLKPIEDYIMEYLSTNSLEYLDQVLEKIFNQKQKENAISFCTIDELYNMAVILFTESQNIRVKTLTDLANSEIPYNIVNYPNIFTNAIFLLLFRSKENNNNKITTFYKNLIHFIENNYKIPVKSEYVMIVSSKKRKFTQNSDDI